MYIVLDDEVRLCTHCNKYWIRYSALLEKENDSRLQSQRTEADLKSQLSSVTGSGTTSI